MSFIDKLKDLFTGGSDAHAGHDHSEHDHSAHAHSPEAVSTPPPTVPTGPASTDEPGPDHTEHRVD